MIFDIGGGSTELVLIETEGLVPRIVDWQSVPWGVVSLTESCGSVGDEAEDEDGESLAGAAKKAECIVTGGAASIAVSFQGKTYYVCCSGCRDAFNEDPAKIIAAAAKAGKK